MELLPLEIWERICTHLSGIKDLFYLSSSCKYLYQLRQLSNGLFENELESLFICRHLIPICHCQSFEDSIRSKIRGQNLITHLYVVNPMQDGRLIFDRNEDLNYQLAPYLIRYNPNREQEELNRANLCKNCTGLIVPDRTDRQTTVTDVIKAHFLPRGQYCKEMCKQIISNYNLNRFYPAFLDYKNQNKVFFLSIDLESVSYHALTKLIMTEKQKQQIFYDKKKETAVKKKSENRTKAEDRNKQELYLREARRMLGEAIQPKNYRLKNPKVPILRPDQIIKLAELLQQKPEVLREFLEQQETKPLVQFV